MIRLLALCVLVMVSSSMACGSRQATEFDLKRGFDPEGVEVEKVSGKFYFNIFFTVSDDATLRLRNPDGIETGVVNVTKEDQNHDIAMCGELETPKGGAYTLSVEDNHGKQIATYTRDFSGASLSIVPSIAPTFAEWVKDDDSYTLNKVNFTTRNGGELPIWIISITCSIDGESIDIPIKGVEYKDDVCFPNNWSLYSLDVAIDGITPGDKTLKIDVKGTSDSIICTYSSLVTPGGGL